MLLEVFLLYLLCSPVCAAHFTVHAYSALPATDLLESVVTSSKCECKLRCLVSIKCMGCTYDNSPSNKSANCQLVTSAHHNDLQTSRNATSFIRLGSADTRTTAGSDDTATSRTDSAELSTLNNGNEETTASKISNEKETTTPNMGKEESTTTKISSKELTTSTIVPKEFPTSTIDRAEPTTNKIDEPTRSKVDEDQSTTSMMDNKDLTTLSSTVSTTTEANSFVPVGGLFRNGTIAALEQACAEHGGLAVLSNDPAYQAVITPQPPDKTCWVGLNQNEQGEWRFHDGILFEDSGISSSNFIGQDINKCTIVKKTNGLLSKQNCTSNMPCVLCTGN